MVLRLSVDKRMYLKVGGAVAALTGVLLMAVSVQMHSDRLLRDVTSSAEPPSELLQFTELLHDPDCARDQHCRSACRMVCEELGTGTHIVKNHASPLIAFGCCLGAPIIEKQVLGPLRAREVQLAEVTEEGVGHEAERLGGSPLADHSSLAANLRALEADEGRQVHRLSTLRAQFQRDEEASRRRVGLLGLGAALPHRAKGGMYGGAMLRSRLFDPRKTHEDDDTINKIISDSDPFGVEPEKEMMERGDVVWKGPKHRRCFFNDTACEEKIKSFEENKRMQDVMQSVTRTGQIAKFRKPEVNYSPYLTKNRDIETANMETRVIGFGEPYEEWEARWPGRRHKPRGPAPDAFWKDPYLGYVHCLGAEFGSPKNCSWMIDEEHEGFEWRRIPGCQNGTIDAANVTQPLDPEDPCVALVSSRVLREAGEDAAHGIVSEQAVIDGLANETLPSDEAIRHFLGKDLYKAYLEEEARGEFFGTLHKRAAAGVEHARLRKAFNATYKSDEFHWCLKQHKHDRDFPKACLRKPPFGRTWQERVKPKTAPEEVFDGVLGGFADFIGEDRQEEVSGPTQLERAGYGHANKLEYGPQVVQPGHLSGAATVAPWLRDKGSRDIPRSVESKEALRRNRQRLPGVNVDSWGSVPPTAYAERAHSIAVTPNSCCHRYITLADYT